MRKRRPNNLAFEDYLDWVKENDLEYQPENWVADCWKARGTTEGVSLRRGRPQRAWKSVTNSRSMVHLTYMCLHKLKESPFSQDIHSAHECGNVWCVNPYHVREADASANENDKKNEENYNISIKFQAQRKKENAKKGLRMPTGLSLKEKAEWLLEKRTYTDENGCRIYNGYIAEDGYARHTISDPSIPNLRNCKRVELHRFIYTALNNLPYGTEETPWYAKGGDEAHHTCKNRSCVNPDHIALVPHSENMIATHAYHKGVKLKEEDVRTVIEAYIEVEEWPLGSKKEFNKLYAEEFGVSPVTIADIVHLKKTWKYLLKEYGLIKEKN